MPKPPAKKPSAFDWVKHWEREIAASEKASEEWRRQAARTLEEYSDERRASLTEWEQKAVKWNYFWAFEQTRLAMLYGQTPTTNVDRRYADADDDAARVAGEMLERALNADLQGANDGMQAALRHALFDFELVDLGVAWVRYEMDEEYTSDTESTIVAPDGSEEDSPDAQRAEKEPTSEVTDERVCIEWVPWGEFLWSAGAKVWGGDHGVRWVARVCEMPRDALVRRFGKDIGRKVPLHASKAKEASTGDNQNVDPRKRARVYEIWSKEHGKCFYFVKGFPLLLEEPGPPPLRLKGFWPCPEPMVGNATTTAFMPRPSYVLCQDLYRELNLLAARAKLLEDAIKVRGVYDGTNESLKRLLSEGGGNELIAADNWAMHAEKGGLKGAVDWFPLEMVVNALVVLQERAREVKATLQEINGHSDVLRGEAMGAGVTATDARRATRMASVRLQHAQDRFARFASDLMRIKAEVMSEMFEPERLIERSNIMQTADGKNPELIQKAVQLLKSGVSDYRIEIRPESVSLEDFAAQRSEAMELMDGMSKFMTAAAGMAQAVPGSLPVMLKMFQGVVSRTRGGRWAEGILDPAVAQAEQAAQQPQGPGGPTPEQMKMQAQQQKAQADMQKEQFKLQADLVKTEADVDAQARIQANQTRENLEEERMSLAMKTQADIQKAAAMPKPQPRNGAPK